MKNEETKTSPPEGPLSAAGHDFQAPIMTPQQFYDKLKYVVSRIKADSEFRQLSFTSRYQIGHLEGDFSTMMKALTGKEIIE